MNNRSVRTNYIFTLVNNFINIVMIIIMTPYLSRVLGVEGIGIKSYTLSIVSTFILFANLGISSYAQREIAIHRENKKEATKILIEITILRFITTSIVILAYYFIMISPIINQNYTAIYIVLLINILSSLLDFTWFLKGKENLKGILIVQIVSKLVSNFIIFILVKEQSDLVIAILISSLVLFFDSIASGYYTFKDCVKIPIKELRPFRHFKGSLVYFVPSIAIQVYTVLDKIMIGILSNTVENGYYEQADKIVHTILMLLLSINTIMTSRMSYLYSKEKYNEMKNFLIKNIKFFGLLGMPTTLGIIVISQEFVLFFLGDGYDKTAIVLNILAPLILIIGISNMLGSQYLTPVGKRKIANNCLIVGAITNLIINWILIPKFGSIGAAIATITAETIITILYLKLSRKFTNIKEIIVNIKSYIVASIFMYVIILIIKSIIVISNLLELLVVIFIGIIFYFGFLIIIKDDFIIFYIKEIISKLRKGKSNGKT